MYFPLKVTPPYFVFNFRLKKYPLETAKVFGNFWEDHVMKG